MHALATGAGCSNCLGFVVLVINREYVVVAVFLTGLLSTISGMTVHIFGRVVYVFYHRKRLAVEHNETAKSSSTLEHL